MQVTANQDITAVILAGGQGSRFDHRDKGWIEWRDKAFVQHVIDRLAPQVSDIVINCNRNEAAYQALGYRTCTDQLADFQGPLAGIQAALALVTTPLALVCPVDSPILPQNLAQLLYQPLMAEQADIAYPSDGERGHYLPVLLKTALLPSLDTYLQGEERRVRRWYQQHRSIEVDLSGQAGAFRNINTAQSLRELDQDIG